ncbi:uncharacterized protein si:dkey-200l5.4 isoform X1 [Ctenopharyngodon idella]|uniref:uncharacterized protein si:dkey-200l5.4 isoform X1 n=1 Tax=Ctenopharyngodon idella TaxID=7959 RepID=UPI002230B840|nr:uncharacterized protein si:dkey-200l5.4 isoform X1 [Ctenopharyngodon idella]
MRTGVPIILFVAVAGFHNAISASLEFDESIKSLEERVYEENITTTQPDESEYASARVKVTEDILRMTHMDGETETLTYNTETKVLEKKDSDDGETGALTDDPGANTGSDESVDKDSEEDSSQQKTAHSEQTEESVRSAEDFSEEDYEEY